MRQKENRELLALLVLYSLLFFIEAVVLFTLKGFCQFSPDEWRVCFVLICDACLGLFFLIMAWVSEEKRKAICGDLGIFFIGGTGILLIFAIFVLLKMVWNHVWNSLER